MFLPCGNKSAHIPSCEGEVCDLTELSVSQNGTYEPSEHDGFSRVVVDVPTGFNFPLAIAAKTGSVYDAEASIVGEYGFYNNWSSLTGVEMLNVKSVGYRAFEGCSSLTEASFPTCSYIGAQAFRYCYSLTDITAPVCTEIGVSAFYDCSNLSRANFPECTTVRSSAFHGCENITEVNMPNCTWIGSNAFRGCLNLSEAVFPNVTRVGSYAFRSCIEMKTLRLDICDSLGELACYDCHALESVYLLSSYVVYLYSRPPFSGTPMVESSYLGHYGSIYVPASLVEEYKSEARWSVFADRITAYEGA